MVALQRRKGLFLGLFFSVTSRLQIQLCQPLTKQGTNSDLI